MSFALTGWMLYTMYAIFGLMTLDVLVTLFKSLNSSFSTSMFLGYFGDVLNYVFPLLIIASLMSLDPTGYVLMIGYYVGGISVILKYLSSIKEKLS